MVIWKNEERARLHLVEHFDILLSEFDAYTRCLKNYFEKDCNVDDEIIENVEVVHKLESKCDSKRRELKEFLYKGGMLPETREDIVKLIDANDKIANKIEYVTDFYTLQKIHIFHTVIGSIYRINEVTGESLKILKRILEVFFFDYNVARKLTKEVQTLEHEVDKLERKFIIDVFSINTSLSEKMILRELINLIGDISDFAEDSTDIISNIMIKRPI